jgi:hypothetical protein
MFLVEFGFKVHGKWEAKGAVEPLPDCEKTSSHSKMAARASSF